LFIQLEFPSYERYWYVFVAPLTNRDRNRKDVRFKSASELKALQRDDYDVYLAQLNYSVLWHLSAVFDMRTAGASLRWDSQLFVNAVIRLCSALDSADEFLQLDHAGRPLPPDPWKDGQNNRNQWRQKHRRAYFLDLQNYRNQLTHSGPFMHWRDGPYFPKVGQHRGYRDWQKATTPLTKRQMTHFVHATEIIDDAWRRTLRYLESSWREVHRKHGVGRTPLPHMYRLGQADESAPWSAAGMLSTATRLLSPAEAVQMSVSYIDPLVEPRTVVSTATPSFGSGPVMFWDPRALEPPLGNVSGSSATPSRVFHSASDKKSKRPRSHTS
jgi:hypothetical protein